MDKIILNNVSLSYPIYGVDTRSLKRKFFDIATGGKINSNKGSAIVSVEALNDITITLKRGDRLGLIGHNGAGKSTFLKLLAQIYEPTKGNITINGSVSALLSLSIGMHPGATGYENIRMRCIMQGYNKQQTKSITQDIEDFTELGNYLSMPIKIYSSGMNLRLAFGLATAITPDILLLDEVVSAGDAQFFQKAQKRMESLIEISNILVLASHSNDLVTKFCNKVLWLEHGKIKHFGDANKVIAEYKKFTQAESIQN